MRRASAAAAAALALTTTMAACGSDSSDSASADGGKTTATIGVLYVGPHTDYGYNQAAYEGIQELKKEMPDVKVLEAENVPETAEASRVMEKMIKDGATVIIPTSYGHYQPAVEVAAKHPDVIFLHQGGPKAIKPNLGTYFGQIYEAQYLTGMAAGLSTKSNKLGYVVAFPIPQTLLNINAFELGAKSVNPKVKTNVVFTANWCDPAKQTEATKSLLDQGADVISQHQDCTKTVVETTERAGAMSVGYHADASSLAPKGWLTGSVWNWGPLYTKMVKAALSGDFASSPYAGVYRVGIEDPTIALAPFGKAVSADTKAKVEAAEAKMRSGELKAFTGPIKNQAGKVVIPAGESPDAASLEATDYLVEGVVGNIPQS
ncbi:MAG: BMP family ABC transporter substrate-binding protein [Solirubrobacteraceae bacterium]|nr:BMP family ABC transporter substrate-binding protein [Solirubrobacteraceae bacterium]